MAAASGTELQEQPKLVYEKDLQLWIEQTIHQLQNREFDSLDIDHLIEELTDLGKSEKRTLESNLMILLAHLLKLKVQQDTPDAMKASWYNSVNEHRQRVQKNLKDTPSLQSYLKTAIEEAYLDGRDLAITDSKNAKFGVRLPKESEYPTTCPFSKEQILDREF